MEAAPVKYIVVGSYFNEKDIEKKFQNIIKGNYGKHEEIIANIKKEYSALIGASVVAFSTSTGKKLDEEHCSGAAWPKWVEKRKSLSFKEKHGFEEPIGNFYDTHRFNY